MIEENNHKIVEEYEIQIKELKKEIANIEEGP